MSAVTFSAEGLPAAVDPAWRLTPQEARLVQALLDGRGGMVERETLYDALQAGDAAQDIDGLLKVVKHHAARKLASHGLLIQAFYRRGLAIRKPTARIVETGRAA